MLPKVLVFDIVPFLNNLYRYHCWQLLDASGSVYPLLLFLQNSEWISCIYTKSSEVNPILSIVELGTE
jgi:DNA-binding PadR family transcriptional regulator